MEERIKVSNIKERQYTCLQVNERQKAETCKPRGKEGWGLLLLSPFHPHSCFLPLRNSQLQKVEDGF